MPGLCFQTSRWIDRLWAEHLEVSKPGRDLVAEGIRKQGSRFAGFGVDLLANLYLPRTPARTNEGPEWASRLHEEALQLAEWQRLRLMCQKNGFASGIAAEVALEQLLPSVPDRPEASINGAGVEEAPRGDGRGSGANDSGPEQEALNLRTALRRAAARARQAVETAETSLEGVATSLGFAGSGSAATPSRGSADLRAIREAHQRLRGEVDPMSRTGSEKNKEWIDLVSPRGFVVG